LAQIGDPSVPVLKNALHNGNGVERSRAMAALVLIGSPLAKGALEEFMNSEPNPDLKKFIQRFIASRSWENLPSK
jgi:hypothetical protein